MKRSKCLLIGLGVVCLAIIPLTGCIGVSQSEYEALQANYEALQAKHGILLEENTRLEASIEAKNATIQERQNELDNMSEELSSTKHEVAMYEEELELYKDTWGSVVASNIEPPYYRIYLTNNEAAVNPTFAELESFLREDKTDKNDYITDVYMCGDFARDVHNNAEKAGIRAAWAAILLESDDGSSCYHACNAFKTTNKGLIFIDCTGAQPGERAPSKSDTRVNVKLDIRYKPRFMFAKRWRVESMGIIRDVEVYW